MHFHRSQHRLGRTRRAQSLRPYTKWPETDCDDLSAVGNYVTASAAERSIENRQSTCTTSVQAPLFLLLATAASMKAIPAAPSATFGWEYDSVVDSPLRLRIASWMVLWRL